MKAVSGQRSVVSGLCKVVCVSLIFIFYFSIFNSATAQSGLYIPSSKPVKNMQKALANAETFCLLISYQGADSAYGISDLDLLDSAYRIAFSLNNPNYYTMSVEGYGDADSPPNVWSLYGTISPSGVMRRFPSAWPLTPSVAPVMVTPWRRCDMRCR